MESSSPWGHLRAGTSERWVQRCD